MKITFFLKYLGGGGAERAMLNLATGFLELGYDVDLVLCQAWGPHLWKIPEGVRLVNLATVNFIHSIFALKKYIEQEKPMTVISALHFANETVILAKLFSHTSTKVIVTEHNTLSSVLKKSSTRKKFLLRFGLRFLYHHATSVVAVSQAVALDLKQYIAQSSRNPLCIFNPAISSEIFSKALEPLNHPWFNQSEIPIILGVGKLEPQKDFTTLIRAFAKVRTVIPARLAILGWGPDKESLEKLIFDLGLEADAKLFGYVDNPYAYMAHSSVFVLSSAWEGLPTVLIEALALGIPVVSTDCPSGPSEILNCGKYGALVPVGNILELSNAILDALNINKYNKVIDTAWINQFTLMEATKKYQELILS